MSLHQDGSTPLILAAQMSREELCAFLLGRGANANIQDNEGRWCRDNIFLFLWTAAVHAVCLCGRDRWNSREGQTAARQSAAVFAKLLETKKKPLQEYLDLFSQRWGFWGSGCRKCPAWDLFGRMRVRASCREHQFAVFQLLAHSDWAIISNARSSRQQSVASAS